MKEPFELDGYWNLPNKPDDDVFGRLTFIPGQRIELELKGLLENPAEGEPRFAGNMKNYSIIVGNHLGDKGPITLHRCQQFKSVSYLNTGFNKITFQADTAYVGHAFKEEEEIKYNKIVLKFLNLAEWINKNPFSSKYQSKNLKEISISYDPKCDLIAEFDEYKISLRLSRLQQEVEFTKITLSYDAEVAIWFACKKPFSDYLPLIKRLQDFFGIAMGAPTYPISVYGESEDITMEFRGEKINAPIQIYYPAAFWPESFVKIYQDKMLFTLQMIEPNFEKYLKNWISKYEIIEPSINLYLSNQYDPKSYAEIRFLSLVQAIETYHRRIIGGNYIDEKEYEKEIYPEIIKALPDKLEKELKSSLISRIRYGNEFSLRTRMREIIKLLKKNLEIGFIQKTKESNGNSGEIAHVFRTYSHSQVREITG